MYTYIPPPPPHPKAVLPFCDEEQYSTCLIEIDTLGLYYGCIDAFITMFFLAGYLWVHSFIKDEFESVKRATVTAGGACRAGDFGLG